MVGIAGNVVSFLGGDRCRAIVTGRLTGVDRASGCRSYSSISLSHAGCTLRFINFSRFEFEKKESISRISIDILCKLK